MRTKISVVFFIYLFLASLTSFSQISAKSKTIQVSADANTEVVPDIIKIQINLVDTLSNKSIDTQDSDLQTILKSIDADLLKDIFLKDQFSSTDKKRGQYNVKKYILTLHTSAQVDNFFRLLNEYQLPHAYILSVSYSKKEEILDKLRVDAVLKAQKIAKSLAAAVNQSIGSAINIECQSVNYSNDEFVGYSNGARLMAAEDDNQVPNIKKVTIRQTVSATFELR